MDFASGYTQPRTTESMQKFAVKQFPHKQGKRDEGETDDGRLIPEMQMNPEA